ncbi:MAG TPA: AzlC family ABC transporter permease [Mobilitalea sp.]|nr:AzlC family ABC transporter permease [Mobilitalea sp.]
MTENNNKKYIYGIKRGLPIAFGYIPVSFTFGIMAVSGGMPIWMAVFISLSNLTSAGQFAGTNRIIAGAGYWEIAIVTLTINLRYMLMSLSLSQRVERSMNIWKRLLVSFGITDETFSVASMEPDTISFPYLMGLITGPILGWTLGTALGAMISSALPEAIGNAMGIALYGMFIAIILPPSKRSRPVRYILLLSITVVCLLRYIPLFKGVSPGLRIIIATFVGAGIGALLFPVDEGTEQGGPNES